MSPTSYTLSDNDRTTDRLLPGGFCLKTLHVCISYQKRSISETTDYSHAIRLKVSHRKYQMSVNHLRVGTMQKVHPIQSIGIQKTSSNDCEQTILNGLEPTIPHVTPHTCWNIDPQQVFWIILHRIQHFFRDEALVVPDLFILRYH
ncbi:hypothetical protein CEXT_362481 [Caerostris extrusa]|uniref:Uncharacterized protein n=1 Tax=Caerostris extrusa TaxID=172846 RepID=A0AAV4VD97_CAEEX|nr:hypothetical protein CEXT_362481 [Caerostris extrusa]